VERAPPAAWLGPCIGPKAFEVGPEVKAAFERADAGAGALFQAHGAGKWLADLPGLARRRLQALGVTSIHGNDGGDAWCTVADRSRFFSHRRDRGASGRLAAAVWLG
jgi:polyphenol oxidase